MSVHRASGFQHDTNAVTLLRADGATTNGFADGQAFGRQGDTGMCR